MDDVVLRLILRDEFKATLQAYKTELSSAAAESKAASATMSQGFAGTKSALADFSRGLATVASGFAAYELGAKLAAKAAEALSALTVGAAKEFDDDARAAKQLGTALANMGNAADTERLVSYAGAMQALSGKTDDSIIGIETYFATLGNGAAEIERMTKLTLNMAPVFGSVEGAMKAVERATNGEVSGLSHLGISFTEAEKKGQDVEGVLRKLEAATAGQAEASRTASEALSRSFENLQGAIGEHLSPSIKELKEATGGFLDILTEMMTGVNAFAATMAGNNPIMKLAQQFDAADRAFQEAQKQYLASAKAGPWEMQAAEEQKLVELGQERLRLLTELQMAQKKGYTPEKIVAANKVDDEATAAAKKLAEEQARLLDENRVKEFEQHQAAFREQWEGEKAVADYRDERLKKSAEYEKNLRLSQNNFLEIDQIGNDTGARQAALDQADAKVLSDNFLEETIMRESMETKIAADKEREQEDLVRQYGVDMFEIEAQLASERARLLEQNAEDFGVAVADLLTVALAGGDITGALTSLGASAASAAASAAAAGLGGTLGAFAGPVAGALAASGVTALSGAIFGAGPQTQGGIDRASLTDTMGDFGFETMEAMERSLFEATGQADIWQTWAEMIVGSEAIGGGGEILAGAFDDLGVSMIDAAAAVGQMIAETQGITRAEADMAVASGILLSNSALTNAELAKAALMFADNATYLEEEARLKEAVLADAKAFAAAGGDQGGAEFAQLQADRNALIGLQAQQFAEQQQADADMVAAFEAAGLSPEDAQQLVNSQKPTEDLIATSNTYLAQIAGNTAGTFHSGQFPGPGASGESFARVRNDELIAGPERYGEAANYLASKGYYPSSGSGGGGGQTVHHNYYVSGVVGDLTAVAEKLEEARQQGQRHGFIKGVAA